MFNGVKLSGTDILVRAKDSKVKGAGREGWPVRSPGTCLATEPILFSGLKVETQMVLDCQRPLFKTCLAHTLAQELI